MRNQRKLQLTSQLSLWCCFTPPLVGSIGHCLWPMTHGMVSGIWRYEHSYWAASGVVRRWISSPRPCVTHPKILTNLTNDSLTQFHLCMPYRSKSTLTCMWQTAGRTNIFLIAIKKNSRKLTSLIWHCVNMCLNSLYFAAWLHHGLQTVQLLFIT